MSKQIFYVTCLYPSQSVTKGQDYIVENESDTKITVKADNGKLVSLMRFRFGDLQLKEISDDGISDQVVCIDANDFKYLTRDKIYDVISEKGEFYSLANDYGSIARYSKKYFKEVPKVIPDHANEKFATCVFAITNELSFAKQYEFKEVDKLHVEIVNDAGKKAIYIKKRFKF